MRFFKLEEKNFSKILSAAERILRLGGIIIAPTDTVYGILANAANPAAVKKIFAMKNRSPQKPMPIFVKNAADARKYAYISDVKAKFLEKVWPGAVTVVFEHKEKLPWELTAGFPTIGLRAPANEFLLELLARLDFPLAETSANLSGDHPAKNAKEIKSYFKNAAVKPDLIIDAGEIAGTSSTVIDFTGQKPLVLRTGLMTQKEFAKILEKF